MKKSLFPYHLSLRRKEVANFTTIQKMPFMPEGVMTDFDRSEDREFRIAGETPVEIYNVVSDNTGTNQLPTGFQRVLGGWVFGVTDNGVVSAASVLPLSSDPTVANVTGLPAAVKTHLVAVYGDK